MVFGAFLGRYPHGAYAGVQRSFIYGLDGAWREVQNRGRAVYLVILQPSIYYCLGHDINVIKLAIVGDNGTMCREYICQ